MNRNQHRAANARHQKWMYEKGELIAAWAKATGRPSREWWDAARADGLRSGVGAEHNRTVRAWFRAAIESAEGGAEHNRTHN